LNEIFDDTTSTDEVYIVPASVGAVFENCNICNPVIEAAAGA
jgi:hypothetical protein